MTKGPGFGSEGVCNPVKELHTQKTPIKEEANALQYYDGRLREMGAGKEF